MRPLFTPSGRQSQQSARTPTPPTEFEKPPSVQGPPRPKFEPIEKFKPSVKLDEILKPSPVFKPKPVQAVPTEKIIATPALQPGPPPEIAYTMGPQKLSIIAQLQAHHIIMQSKQKLQMWYILMKLVILVGVV